MATTGPSTPDNTPRKAGGGLGRSFSTPAKTRGLSGRPTYNTTTTAAIGEAAGIETLYTNANGKVVKFNCAPVSRPTSSAGRPQSGTVSGTLPWATLTEQTLASGPLEIYRVPGSVSFLHSGSLLHAILPRSNCWCVDGVSKFAMRVLTDTYYRIELPGETEEQLAEVEEFKATLKKVLFYERTACPFARTFEVPLPEEQVRKKRRNTTHGPAKKWKQDRAYSWRPEDGGEPPHLSTSEEEESGGVSEEEVEISKRIDGEADNLLDDVEDEPENAMQDSTTSSHSQPSVRERVDDLTVRSVTAPSQMSLHSNAPSRIGTGVLADNSKTGSRALDPPEPRSLQAIPTDMPPSPPDSSAGFEYAEQTTTSDQIANRSGSPLHNPRLRPHREERSSFIDKSLEPDLRAEADWQSDIARSADETSIHPQPPNEHVFVNVEYSPQLAHVANPTISEAHAGYPLDWVPPVPEVSDATPVLPNQTSEHTPTPHTPTAAPEGDPFAQIQARIQARRSIGGTTTSGFVPHPRQTSTSTQGASPPTVRKPSAVSGRTLSHKSSSISRQSSQQQQYLATALVKKACAVFLGPPVHLVALMLRIAARFAKGVIPKSFLYESPRGERRRVPGSYILESDDDYGLSSDDDDGEEPLDAEELEDDFGVPIDSPVRLSSAVGLRERVKWDVG